MSQSLKSFQIIINDYTDRKDFVRRADISDVRSDGEFITFRSKLSFDALRHVPSVQYLKELAA